MYLKQAPARLLVAIADTGKLQTAADTIAMSQPAASRALSELETRIGHALFERHPKGMTPTPFGEILIRRARATLFGFHEMAVEIDNLNAGHAGEVRVGAVTGPAVGCLVPALRHLKSIAPNVEPTVDVGPSTVLFRALQEEHYDFIIARPPPDMDTRAYRILPARAEVVSLVVRRDHPLKSRTNVQLSDLVDYEWIIQERGSPIRFAVDNAFHSNGIPTPQNITNSSSLLVMLAMLRDSTAIAPLTHEVADLLKSDNLGTSLAMLDLQHQITVTPSFIMYKKGRVFTRATQILMDEVIARL